ncbi:ubiquitin family protein, partial [Teladorsagia circumcincta]
ITMLVKVSVGSKSFPIEIGKEDGSISTLGQFKTHVAKEANIESSCMKIIHRGKTITGEDDLSLLDMNFKDNDKILIMGKVSSSLKDDPGFSALVAYEKANLVGLQKQHEQIESDLSAMELNFLDVQKSLEMVKRMEKRLANFTETSMKHLEALDGLSIIGELTSETQ